MLFFFAASSRIFVFWHSLANVDILIIFHMKRLGKRCWYFSLDKWKWCCICIQEIFSLLKLAEYHVFRRCVCVCVSGPYENFLKAVETSPKKKTIYSHAHKIFSYNFKWWIQPWTLGYGFFVLKYQKSFWIHLILGTGYFCGPWEKVDFCSCMRQ